MAMRDYAPSSASDNPLHVDYHPLPTVPELPPAEADERLRRQQLPCPEFDGQAICSCPHPWIAEFTDPETNSIVHQNCEGGPLCVVELRPKATLCVELGPGHESPLAAIESSIPHFLADTELIGTHRLEANATTCFAFPGGRESEVRVRDGASLLDERVLLLPPGGRAEIQLR